MALPLYELPRIIKLPLFVMNLSLDERRQRLRQLAETHSGLVLASALLKDSGCGSAKAERPITNEKAGEKALGSTAPARRPHPDPGTARKRPGKRARQGGIQLDLW